MSGIIITGNSESSKSIDFEHRGIKYYQYNDDNVDSLETGSIYKLIEGKHYKLLLDVPLIKVLNKQLETPAPIPRFDAHGIHVQVGDIISYSRWGYTRQHKGKIVRFTPCGASVYTYNTRTESYPTAGYTDFVMTKQFVKVTNQDT